jgi:hypothetical protein
LVNGREEKVTVVMVVKEEWLQQLSTQYGSVPSVD